MTDESDYDVYLPGIVAGEPAAFAAWLRGAEPRVRSSLRSFATALDVEAVLQEALLRVWQVAPKFEPDGRVNALLRFAIRVARNHALGEVRRRRVRPALLAALEAEPEAAVFVPPPDPLLRKVILLCREKLPKKPAAALAARLVGGVRSDDELAQGLGMKLNTFLQNFGRARKLLARCLEANGVRVL